MLNPAAIVRQGFGFAPRLVAVRGFAVVVDQAERSDYPSGADDGDRARVIRNNNQIMLMLSAFLATGTQQ